MEAEAMLEHVRDNVFPFLKNIQSDEAKGISGHMKTEYCNHEIQKRVQGAVTKTITKNAIRQIPIYLPPIEMQKKFVRIVEMANRVSRKYQNSTSVANELLDSLSQKAFLGEL